MERGSGVIVKPPRYFLSIRKKVSHEFLPTIGGFFVLSEVGIRGLDCTERWSGYLVGVCGVNHENADVFVHGTVRRSFLWGPW